MGPFRAGQSLNPNLKPGADGQLVFRVQCGEFPKIGDPRVPLKGSLKGYYKGSIKGLGFRGSEN